MRGLISILFVLSFCASVIRSEDVGCFSSISGIKLLSSAQYQSSGKCMQTCSDYPYFALRNGDMCYCLSSKPTSNEVSSSQCNVGCDGYGQEDCGGSSAYRVVVGLGSSDSSSEDSSYSLTDQSYASSTDNDVASSTEASTSTDSSASTSAPESTTSDSLVSNTVITSTKSSKGSIIYKTVTTDAAHSSGSKLSTTSHSTTSKSSATSTKAASTSSSESSSSSKKESKSKVGPIVGGVVGGIGGVILVAIAVFFIIKKRRQDDEDDEEEFYDKSSGLGRGGTNKSRYGNSPLDRPVSNPFTHPSDATVAAGGGGSAGLVDPRLNPMMMGRRRLSDGSLADEADYSRKILQVANPDS
ncbi:uncharacterized protein PRCAT00002584001 [Priceomyces carsonii]|uniref:uncharacterized protein n=1 Tax=Priceomyces carsonii TaxID=28549 RepID=UPI002EDA6152|nr:unnamed protein product [Priceomyces carsonii]